MVKIELDWSEFNKRLGMAVEGIGLDVQEALKDKLTFQHGKFTGAGQSGINYEVQKNNNSFTIILNIPEHLKYVEYGTPGMIKAPAGQSPKRRKMPPIDAIRPWAKKKLGDEKLAFALAKHIQLYGTRPYPFIRNTFDLEVPDIISENLKRQFG